MNPIRTLVLFCIVVAATFGTSPAVSQSQEFQPPEIKLISLNFAGGTAADYVAALKKAAGGLNVYVAPEAAQVPMPAIELTGVTPSTALQLLHDRRSMTNDAVIQLKYDEMGSESHAAERVFSIQAAVSGRNLTYSARSQVWSVSGILSMGVKTDDMLTAIQTALDLLGNKMPEAQIRFHEATGILIVRATEEQLGAINAVLEMVDVAASERRAANNPSDVAVKELRSALHERELQMQQMQVRIQALEAELAAAKKH